RHRRIVDQCRADRNEDERAPAGADSIHHHAGGARALMCDPLSIAGVARSAVGGGIGARGSLQQGRDAAASYEVQALFADRQSVLERQAGAYERDRLRTRNDRQLAGMRHQYVSAGIDPSSGSAREVIADSAREAALDEEAVLFGAMVRADNQKFTARL